MEVFLDKLDDLVLEYNKKKHSSIGMSPIAGIKEKEMKKKVFAKLFGKEILKKRQGTQI